MAHGGERTEVQMSKQRILTMLKEQQEGYLSGEAMSQQLGISRAAVNKAVNSLRQDGYEIESATRKGYRLLSSPDLLTEGEIRPWLRAGELGSSLLCFPTIDSTNSYLKRESHNLPAGTVAVADQQTGGRGRLGRAFHSPKGTGIYLSALLKPEVEPTRALNLTAYVAVAICEAVERATGLQPGIKWTNDLVLGGRKICGILTEMAIEGESGTLQHVIPGIGLNVNEDLEDFPEDIRNVAGSLAMAAGRKLERGRLAAEMINSLDRMYSHWQAGGGDYLDRYRALCLTVGKEVQVIRTGMLPRAAFAEAVDDDFGLVVRYPDGSRETVTAGEVSVRGLCGYV